MERRDLREKRKVGIVSKRDGTENIEVSWGSSYEGLFGIYMRHSNSHIYIVI